MTTDPDRFPYIPAMRKPDVDENCGLYTEDDGLELSLGLSLGGSFSRVKKNDDEVKPMTSPIPNPQKQKSSLCNEASLSLKVKSEIVMHDQAPSQSSLHGLNEEWKTFEAPIYQSREQVWQTLQKNGAVSVKGSIHAEGATAFRESKDASASLLIRSMQLMELVKEGLLSTGSGPLSRQVSSVECLLEKNPETPPSCAQQQQALELQKKKEMQAQRRQEARKRRKSLIEEKQQKKAKREERSCIPQTKSTMSDSSQKNSSASVTTQDGSCPQSQKSGLRRLGSKELVQSYEKSCVDDETRAQEISLDLQDVKKGGREVAESCVVAVEVQGEGNLLQGMEQDRVRRKQKIDHRSHSMQMATTKASLNFDSKHEAEKNLSKDADEGDGGVFSPTESCESKEEHSGVQQNDSSELEASSTPSCLAPPRNSYGGSSFFPSMILPTNNSVSYHAPPFPVFPIPYPFHLQASSPAALPFQMGFSLPCFMQYPPPAVGENPVPPTGTSSQLPVSSGMAPYALSMPDGSFPWFPLVPSTPVPAQSSCALPLNSCTSNELQMQHPRGELNEDAEKSSVAAPPVEWAKSTSNTKEVSAQLDSGIPVLAPQPCPVGKSRDTRPERRKVRTATRNARAQRQKKLSLAGPTLAQDTGAVEQSLSLQMDDHIPKLKRSDSRPEKSGESDPSEDFSTEGKREEASADSQLASELSGLEGPNVQPGMVENEKRASILDLPWVSTTGVGPNGKTINGVMYISKTKQVRLVCSCHGNHMSPTEFVEHSGSTDLSNPERSIVVNPFPFLNQLAPAPV